MIMDSYSKLDWFLPSPSSYIKCAVVSRQTADWCRSATFNWLSPSPACHGRRLDVTSEQATAPPVDFLSVGGVTGGCEQ